MSDTVPVPEITLTDKIRDALEEVERVEQIDAALKEQCKHYSSQSKSKKGILLPVSIVKDVYNALKKHGKKIHLHELVEGADFIPTQKVPPPRDPELEARVQKLKIKEENREYRRMTQNVDPMQQSGERFSFQDDVKSMNRQLTSVLNFLITVAAGFAFGYKFVEYTYGRAFPIQMMAGLTVGTVIFFVDLYFMVKYAPI